MLISPTEPPSLKVLGEVDARTEKYGVDYLYATQLGMVGVQRKEYGDLLASVQGSDRLYRECMLMKQLDIGIWMIEGRPQWTTDGKLLSQRQWTYQQHLGLMSSLQLQGYWTYSVGSLAESIMYLSQLQKWLDKAEHLSTKVRPKPEKNSWGLRSNEDWAIHILQGFEIGPKTAKNMYDMYGLPLQWTVSEGEMAAVRGIGKVRARKLTEALENG